MSIREWPLLLAGKKAADLRFRRRRRGCRIMCADAGKTVERGGKLLALALALVKELSGEAGTRRRAPTSPAPGCKKPAEAQIYVQTTGATV